MDSISLHLDIQNSLVKTLQQTQVLMRGFNDSLAGAGKLTRTVNDHIDEISESSKKITVHTKAWNVALGKTRDLFMHIMAPVAAIFSVAKIVDVTRAMLEHNTVLTQLSYRMGDMGKTTSELTSAMYGIADAIGISTDKAITLVSTLRKLRVPADQIREMGITTAKFAEVTGTSADLSAQLAGNLMRVGKLGTKDTKDLMTAMAGVQRQVGLTDEQMNSLAQSTIGFTQYLSQIGRSAAEIKDFNKGVVNLAGAFEKVGLKAEKAAEMIDSLIDPGRIEENALMLSKLGISIADIVAGEVDMEDIQKGMAGLGQEIKDMGGPAGAALAKSMGMSRKELIAMADLQGDLLNDTDSLNKMYEDQQTPQVRMAKTMERMSTLMEKTAHTLLPIFEKVATGMEFVFKIIKKIFSPTGGMIVVGLLLVGLAISKLTRKFFAMNTEVAQHQEKAMTEALIMSHKKAAEVTSRRAPSPRRSGLAARIQAAPAFTAMQAEADRFATIMEVDLLPGIKRLAGSTEQWMRSIAMGVKPVSRISILTEQLGKRAKERLNLSEQERFIQKGLADQEGTRLKQQHAVYAARIDTLKQMEKLTAEQKWELKHIELKHAKLDIEIKKNNELSRNIEKRYDSYEKRYLRKLAPEERHNMLENLKNQKQITDKANARAKEDLSALGTQKDLLGLQKDILEKAKEELAKKMESKERSAEIVARYNEIHKQLTGINQQQDSNTAEMREQEKILQATRDEHEKINRELVKVAGAGRAEGGAVLASFPRRMAAAAKAIGNNISGKAIDAAKRIGNSAKVFGKSVVERLNPKNWWAAIRSKMRGFGDDEGKKTRGVMKGFMGPLALLVGALLSSKVVRELLTKVMKQIRPLLDQVATTLLPVFEKLLKAFMPLVTTLINILMPPLLKILGAAVVILGTLVKAIGNLAMFMMELPARIGAFIKHPFDEFARAQLIDTKRQELMGNKIYQAAFATTQFGKELIESGKELWGMKYTPVQLGAGGGAAGARAAAAGAPALVRTVGGRPQIVGTAGVAITPEEETAAGVGELTKSSNSTAENTELMATLLEKYLEENSETNKLLVVEEQKRKESYWNKYGKSEAEIAAELFNKTFLYEGP